MKIAVGDFAPQVRVEAYVRNEPEPVALELGESGGDWTVLFAPGLRGVEYPVIADPTQELTRLFGALDPADGSARPATFIIDADGVVRHTSVANGILGADGPEDALRVLRALCRDDRALLAAA